MSFPNAIPRVVTTVDTNSQPDHTLYAYEVADTSFMDLAVAPSDRAWMSNTDQRFANRCLPLLIANAAGWIVRNPVKFSVCWKGGIAKEDLLFEFPNNRNDSRILSHFGHGILTFTLPYLFRTPKDIHLWVKGPSNWPKDGTCALEGIVETDWTPSTFTMNWKMTRPYQPVLFDQGEPICMIVPVPRGLAETLTPIQIPIASNPVLEAQYNLWDTKRKQFNSNLVARHADTVARGWEKDYFKGLGPDGSVARQHQTQLNVKSFRTPAG